jgi:hypothetical protein
MKNSFHFTRDELTDLIASVLGTNGHNAVGGVTLFKDGQPIEFDEARIEVSAQLVVRCVPEMSQYEKLRQRYQQSVGQVYSEPANETQ